MNGPLDAALAVSAALDRCGVPYTVGGSLASSFSGEPRASIDADILIDMTQDPPLDRRQLARRVRVRVATNPDRFLYVHSPEDILLQKLHWYQLGGEVSDRQWRDAISVIVVQGARLDRDDLTATARALGLADLLDRALRESGGTLKRD